MKKSHAVLPIAGLLAIGLLVHRLPGARHRDIASIDNIELARDYERVTNTPQFAAIRWLAGHRAVNNDFGGKAIDVGGGPGKLSIDLARMAPRATFVSMDSSQEMVDLTNERARDAGVSGRVEGALGTSEHIPFPDDYFDLAVSTLSLHHWDNPIAALQEIDRVLKPDGRLLIMDLRRDAALLPWLFVNVLQRVIPFPALRRAGEPTGSFKAAFTPDEVTSLLVQAGLKQYYVTSGPAWLTIEK